MNRIVTQLPPMDSAVILIPFNSITLSMTITCPIRSIDSYCLFIGPLFGVITRIEYRCFESSARSLDINRFLWHVRNFCNRFWRCGCGIRLLVCCTVDFTFYIEFLWNALSSTVLYVFIMSILFYMIQDHRTVWMIYCHYSKYRI